MKKTIVSGMRPTGRVHIGHLAGVYDNWLKFQKDDKCYFEIADWHAITDRTDHSKMRQNIYDMAIDWMALGINPEKSTIFLQSLVPEHAEMQLLFSSITNVGSALRCPVYKDKTSGKNAISNPTLGLLNYPILQAGDIALYKGTHVPVGEDQAPHIELSREIIRKFNTLYGPTFPEPETILTEVPRLKGTDGCKMGKSTENSISPHASLEQLANGAKRMITDTQKIRLGDPGRPEVCTVYDVHKLYSENRDQIANSCKSGELGCGSCKTNLANTLYQRFEEFREKRAELESNYSKVKEIIYEGSKDARKVAKETMAQVREVMKLDF